LTQALDGALRVLRDEGMPPSPSLDEPVAACRTVL
jgi:hypothetical protein